MQAVKRKFRRREKETKGRCQRHTYLITAIFTGAVVLARYTGPLLLVIMSSYAIYKQKKSQNPIGERIQSPIV
jgi:hypothetical protein